jgi:hypothetical protein
MPASALHEDEPLATRRAAPKRPDRAAATGEGVRWVRPKPSGTDA